MPYIGRSTDGFGVRNRFLYLASADDTSVSGADANGATLTFTDGAYVDVYLNGVLLKAGTDYNTNTAGTIASLSAMSANDEVTVIVYDVFTVGDMVSATSGGTFVGNVNFNGDIDVDGTANLDVVDIDGAVDMASTLAVGSDVTIRNTSSTGPSLNVGTTSTSVSNGGYVGGILFTASTANSAVARVQALSNGQTDAGATGTGADFSFECRNNNASFAEKFLIKGSGDISIQKNTNGFGNFTSFGTVTLADDASITITSGSHTGGANHFYVYETATGSNCVYYGGYNKTAVLTNNYLETGGIGFASANSDGNVSFYSDGAHSLTFQNREGSSKTFKLMKVGVGATFNDTA